MGHWYCRVTRLGDLLDFGELFKAFGNNLFCPNLPHSWAIFVKVSKSFIFLVKSFLGNFYRHLATFYWSHWVWGTKKNNFEPLTILQIGRGWFGWSSVVVVEKLTSRFCGKRRNSLSGRRTTLQMTQPSPTSTSRTASTPTKTSLNWSIEIWSQIFDHCC